MIGENCGVLLCTIINQYGRKFSNHFPVFIDMGESIDQVRERILNKLMQFKIYYKNRGGKDEFKEIDDE